ncbi:hypothetical protein BKA65DRAFT_494353 [Rhexocercosporidium sp. MPI-PUGE-AT-0058]|nr:hypothetical protein BKA65DRAFT_494353 [Rhexocercosporidium sp. MPI-PUGE-AT-0058]
MPQNTLSVFMNGYLDPSQVAIGRLVLDMKSPGQNFCPYGALDLKEDDVSKAPFSNLKSLSNSESSSSFKLALSKVLQLFASKSRTTVDDISTKKAIRHQLLNVNLKFEKMFENDEIKKWLEKVILTGSDIYMVVGLHTLQDASISLNRDVSTEAGAKIQAPIADTLAPGLAAVPGVKEALDVKLEGTHTSKSSLGASFVAPGERIIAVQYQKVAVKMLSSKGIKGLADARLKKKTTWQAFGAARGDSELDTFEISLAEEIDDDDIAEDGDFEAMSVGDGEVFVILA